MSGNSPFPLLHRCEWVKDEREGTKSKKMGVVGLKQNLSEENNSLFIDSEISPGLELEPGL